MTLVSTLTRLASETRWLAHQAVTDRRDSDADALFRVQEGADDLLRALAEMQGGVISIDEEEGAFW